MAVRYAVATGNWSDTATWDGGTLPTSADDVYSNGFTVTIDIDIEVQSIRNTAQSPAVAGGSYVLNGDVTVDLLSSISGTVVGNASLINYSASTGTSTINGVIKGSINTSFVSAIIYSGAANLNITGNLTSGTLGGGGLQPAITKSGTGTLTIVGNLSVGVSTNGNHCLNNTGQGSINITGNLTGQIGAGSGRALNNTNLAPINITGDVFAGSSQTDVSEGIFNNAANSITITGNIYSNNANAGIQATGAHNLNITGTLTHNSLNALSTTRPAVTANNLAAVNIFTGPFVSSPYGFMPFQVLRMHYFRTIGSYFEFRDETTNGVLSPGSVAPATRLVSPDTVVDAPIPSDVRDGVSYALNTFTGTLKVPPTASVAFGVPVDNTTGVALLTGDSWIAAISSSNDPFAERLRNTATVQTTAAQIAAF
jgi:hypothetical protein